ncbi:hypothetical protein QTP70_007783 [Hemibagrus guttatus]|uniref:Alkylated DNA repair protein AlkB homologue 8 N-terminal domain-containing protein n=1 Tax=Hemibagrus guttatus TaxID=175788 RepID=A0AAE0R1Z7_9TELE|nr:hypothetical protein QTP70_007783 [Hemibagrus guttatus]
MSLITNNNEVHYRSEVNRLAQWCTDNNLFLKVGKTKVIVTDFRRGPPQYPPLTINGATVERVNNTKFLGVHISEDLSWMTNTTSLAKKAQSRLYFLRKLRKALVPPPLSTGGPLRALSPAASLCGTEAALPPVERLYNA